jgi:transcriptional regulator with XRE-family HTH domain
MSHFVEFWKNLSPGAKTALARRLRTSKSYLSQLAHGHRLPSPRMHELLEVVTGERFLFGAGVAPGTGVARSGDDNRN